MTSKKNKVPNDDLVISKKDLDKAIKEAVSKEMIKKEGEPSSSFFKGRMTRSSYIPRAILLAILNLIAYGAYKASAQGVAVISILFMIIFSVYGFSIVSKRFHDRGKSGWYYLLLFIPIVNIWFTIELLFFRGTVGRNKYGEDPLKSKK